MVLIFDLGDLKFWLQSLGNEVCITRESHQMTPYNYISRVVVNPRFLLDPNTSLQSRQYNFLIIFFFQIGD